MEKESKYKQYIWQLPVRWCHWVNVLSIVVLAVTGILIGNPVFVASSTDSYMMGWIRFFHFVFAYAFAVSVIARMIWSIRGNCFAGWREYFPFVSRQGRENMVKMLKYYTFQTHEVPEVVGHNPLAATAYFVLFLLYWFMILTGFAMYAEYAPGGLMHSLLKPVYMLMTTQQMHLYHHLAMWLIFGFVINHIYSAWLMDIKERGGEISSMFCGFKFTIEKDITCGSRHWEFFPRKSKKGKS